ncbi:MAG: ABC transporter six-transmembrane domain-containing protein [Pseudomonadota bacterium]
MSEQGPISSRHAISLGGLWRRYFGRISLTMLLVAIESGLGVLYPLAIGIAIDDLLKDSYRGLIQLGILGLASTVIGSLRRFYDTRIYARIYQGVATELVEREHESGANISRISARVNLLTEFVEFFEQSMPELIGAVVSLIGILLIVAGLSLPVLFACAALLVLVVIIYTVTAAKNYRLNAGYNDELEGAVSAISSKSTDRTAGHFQRLMRWNIHLSDLETWNYLVFWLGAVGLFIYAPFEAVSAGVLEVGLILSLLLYVFEFINWLAELPIHIQQFIRLKEIADRLQASDTETDE